VDFVSPALAIFAISFGMVIVSELIKWKFFDKEKVERHQKEMKKKQEILKELMKEGDKRKKEIDKLQGEMLEHTSEILGASNKLMLVSLPIFLVMFWILGFLYKGLIFEALFPLPKFVDFSIINPFSWFSWFQPAWPPIIFTATTGYYKAYFFSYFISSLIVGAIKKVYKKIGMKQEKFEEKK
jgi:uncharacterized membrane protein (DUF106 family)